MERRRFNLREVRYRVQNTCSKRKKWDQSFEKECERKENQKYFEKKKQNNFDFHIHIVYFNIFF